MHIMPPLQCYHDRKENLILNLKNKTRSRKQKCCFARLLLILYIIQDTDFIDHTENFQNKCRKKKAKPTTKISIHNFLFIKLTK